MNPLFGAAAKYSTELSWEGMHPDKSTVQWAGGFGVSTMELTRQPASSSAFSAGRTQPGWHILRGQCRGCHGKPQPAPSIPMQPSCPVPVRSPGAAAGPRGDAGVAAGPSRSKARLLAAPFASPGAGTALCPQPCSSPFRALFSLSSLLIWERILRMSCRRCAFPSMVPVPHPAAGTPCPLKPLRVPPRTPSTAQIPALGGMDRAVRLPREAHDLFIHSGARISEQSWPLPTAQITVSTGALPLRNPPAPRLPLGLLRTEPISFGLPKKASDHLHGTERGSPFAGQQFISSPTRGD